MREIDELKEKAEQMRKCTMYIKTSMDKLPNSACPSTCFSTLIHELDRFCGFLDCMIEYDIFHEEE